MLLGQYKTYSRRQTSSLALPHQPSQPPRHDQYEICGLTRNPFQNIFFLLLFVLVL
ncbi:MAG: hypothetical protein K9M81_05195 [Chthoniobacterales bacterium]|nr:hypothetical protein [Chthoniobacterales bacterium]